MFRTDQQRSEKAVESTWERQLARQTLGINWILIL